MNLVGYGNKHKSSTRDLLLVQSYAVAISFKSTGHFSSLSLIMSFQGVATDIGLGGGEGSRFLRCKFLHHVDNI